MVHRLFQEQEPISKLHEAKAIKLCNELQKNPILGMLVDAMHPKYDFEKNVKVILPDRKD